VSLEELARLELFQGTKRAFKVKLNTNFAPRAGQEEPGIKAAVRRRFAPGEVICRAGDYGSTAFLLVEGKAVARLPELTEGRAVPGRSRGSFARIRRMFERRTRTGRSEPADAVAVGEVSRYASASAPRPAGETEILPGQLFGIDACVNFYPREATVEAREPSVVIEMLRSVVDSIRDAGGAGAAVDQGYEAAAIANQLALSPLTADLGEEERARLAAAVELLTPDSDSVKNGILYGEGDPADAVFLVRSGTIKLARQSNGREIVFSYLGRGSAFGFEGLLPSRRRTPLVLTCLTHPEIAPRILIEGTLTIGRSAACEVRLPEDDLSVGRRHCQLEERDGEVFLVDLDSTNHTYLNGEQIQRARVAAGDRIQVVDYGFEVSRRTADQTVLGEPIARFATASGLDSFEVVRLPVAALRQLRSGNPRFADALLRIGRQLESAADRESPELVEGMVELNLYNSQNTLLIDLERCTRCDECVKACSDAHGGVARFTRDGPRFGKYLVTMACRSCTDPKCMIGCPVGSIRRGDSLEIQIEDWCIGCERCANQCPFGNINMIEVAAAPAAPRTGEASPAEAAKLRATVCDLCSGYDGPNCVYACPHDAAIRVNPIDFLGEPDRRGLLG
jgi:Fe-S-cluster-containing hydrogenase component 2